MDNFRPKSKVIGLHCCEILTLAKLRETFAQKFLEQKWTNFGQKSKVIGLHFCEILTPTKMKKIFAKKILYQKWTIFRQKVRLQACLFFTKFDSDKIERNFV